MLQAGNAYLELFEYASPAARPADPDRPPADHGYTHFCLDVIDIDAEYERLVARRHDVPQPPAHDRGDSATARLRAIYGRDPDGNIVELQEILDAAVPFALDTHR